MALRIEEGIRSKVPRGICSWTPNSQPSIAPLPCPYSGCCWKDTRVVDLLKKVIEPRDGGVRHRILAAAKHERVEQ